MRNFLLLSVFSTLLCVKAADDKLMMAIEICRHGARSPMKQDVNVTQSFWP
jgi:hypothetical protein